MAEAEKFRVKYMETEVNILAATSNELANHHVSAMVKTVAVFRKDINMLNIERQIVGEFNPKRTMKARVDSACCSKYTDCRTRMDGLMDKAVFTRPEDVRRFMQSKRAVWCKDDKTFELDIDYCDKLCGELGGGYLLDQAVAELPTPEDVKPKTYASVLESIRKITSTTAWTFAAKGPKGQITALIEMLSNMQAGEGT